MHFAGCDLGLARTLLCVVLRAAGSPGWGGLVRLLRYRPAKEVPAPMSILYIIGAIVVIIVVLKVLGLY